MRLPIHLFRFVASCGLCLLATSPVVAGDPAAAPGRRPETKKVVMIAGPTRHPKGTHEHDRGLLLLKGCLDASPNVRNLKVEVQSNNWPSDPRTLDAADTIVMFNEGWDDHLLANRNRREAVRRLMGRGVGLVGLHGATAVSDDVEPDFLDWAGGNKKKVYSQLAFSDGEQTVAAPGHPVARGVAAFAVREEIYYRYFFRDSDPRRTSILTAMLPPEKPQAEVIAWAFERADGGRAFMYAGPHFYTSWRIESLRRLVLNAILWTAKADVPEGGVRSALPPHWEQTTSAIERRSR
jgi:type 1 glutamine amidotransferase